MRAIKGKNPKNAVKNQRRQRESGGGISGKKPRNKLPVTQKKRPRGYPPGQSSEKNRDKKKERWAERRSKKLKKKKKKKLGGGTNAEAQRGEKSNGRAKHAGLLPHWGRSDKRARSAHYTKRYVKIA